MFVWSPTWAWLKLYLTLKETIPKRISCLISLGSHHSMTAAFAPPSRYAVGAVGLGLLPRGDTPRKIG